MEILSTKLFNMTKIYMTAVAFATATISFAQPTLTGTSNNPSSGEAFMQHTVDAATFNQGSSGANVTWDFSNIVVTGSPYTSTFVNASSLSNVAQFNGVPNLAVDDGANQSYWLTNANVQSIVGVVQGANDIVDNYYSDPRELLVFPLTYGSSYNETMDGVQDNNIGGFQMLRTGTITIEGDAHGVLIMPYGTVNNVLRIKVTTVYSDEFQGNIVASYVDVHYMWYSASSHMPLLQYHDFTFAGQQVFSANYLDPQGINISEYSNIGSSVQVYPNPATDVVNVQFSLSTSADVTIVVTDLLGKEVMNITREGAMSGIHNEPIDINGLDNGMYLISIISGDDIVTKKISVR
jgi:hypothetical protein